MSTLNGGAGNIVTDSLVLYLDAANYQSYSSGSIVWRDLSINPITGSLTNSPTFNFGNAGNIQFDGSNDFILLSDSKLNLSQSFTMECWMKTTSATSYSTFISWGQHTNNLDRSMWLQLNTGKLTLYFYPTQTNQIVGTSDLRTNTWRHCVTTWDQTTGRVYVDSILEASRSLVANPYTYTSTRIGSNISNQYFFDGNIAIAKLYNRALSDAEILQNYNATKTRFGL